jgi:hypothetical protein
LPDDDEKCDGTELRSFVFATDGFYCIGEEIANYLTDNLGTVSSFEGMTMNRHVQTYHWNENSQAELLEYSLVELRIPALLFRQDIGVPCSSADVRFKQQRRQERAQEIANR